MKVLFIGAATSNHTLRWVNALANNGHEVLLLTRGDQRANNQFSDKIKIVHLKHGGGLGYYLNVRQTRKIFKEFKPDIVNAHYLTGYGTMARLARLHPLVLSAWGSDVFSFPNSGFLNKRLLAKNVFYADAIASTSHAMADELKRVLPKYKKEITVTPFGIDVNKFKPIEVERNKNEIVIGLVKYLHPIYNIDLLINAFALLKKNYPNVLLHIYGDGPLRPEFDALCASLGITESVKFFGTIPNDQVPMAINGMDIFVNCSRQESFGVAVLEAMACEKPVVVTDTPGYKEIVTNEVDGIMLADREPETMAKALERLVNDASLRNEMGKKGRAKVLEKYSWSDNVSIMEELYKKTASNYGGKK